MQCKGNCYSVNVVAIALKADGWDKGFVFQSTTISINSGVILFHFNSFY